LPPKGKLKTNDEFFDERLNFVLQHANELKCIGPECTDEYNDHSVLKLICINYWLGIFLPVCHKQLRIPYGYQIAYVDTMAGSGITSTKRANDCFTGSCPSVILASHQLEIPFDIILAVEKDKTKARILEERLKHLSSPAEIVVINDDIQLASDEISKHLREKSVSYIVIDPQALQGMTWKALYPLLLCKGDAMITWFEGEAWRLKQAAATHKSHSASQADTARMTELFGTGWEYTDTPEELSQVFINRIIRECNKKSYAKVKIERQTGYYWMILFTGQFPKAEALAEQWESHIKKRIESSHGKEISSLLEIKSGRQASLF
jgi:three-Cys-motif partner protein